MRQKRLVNRACWRAGSSYIRRVQTILDIDPRLLSEAEQTAAQIGKPLSAVVEASLKLFLHQARPAVEAPPRGSQSGSLERDDPFFAILAQIEEERHARLPRETIPLG